MWRVTAFLKRRSSLTREQFVARGGALFEAIAARPVRPSRILFNLPIDPPSERLTAMFGDRFDGVAELWFADEAEAQRVLADIAQDAVVVAAAAAVIDRDASSAWLAEVVPHYEVAGTGVKFVVAGQVADGLTVAEAQTYWREQHFRVARTVDDFMAYLTRYVQMHGRDLLPPGWIDWLARHSFFPMCADMGLRTESDVEIAYSLPSYLAIIRPDEERFSKPGDMLSFASIKALEFA